MLINSPNISGSLTVTGNATITGSLTVAGGINAAITGSATTASYVEYSNIANKPTLVSGSEQVSFNGITDKPTLVSGSEQVSFNGIVDKPTLVSGSAQITYSGLSGIPSGIVSSSTQITGYNIFATTGSNQFNGSQAITGSLTVTGQVVAQTLNVQQVTSSIVFSSGSNIFGNSLSNTQQLTGSVSVTGSLGVAGASTFSSNVGINGSPGTSFPLEAYINSSTTYSSTSRGNVFRVYNSNTDANIFAGIELGGAGSANDGLAGLNAIVTGNGSAALTFYTRDSNTFSERIRITSGGNVLIGSPTSDFGKLDITTTNSTGFTYALTLGPRTNVSEGDSVGISFKSKIAIGGAIWENARIATITENVTASIYGALAFYTMNATTLAERMRITPSGNVGIGTNSPVGGGGASDRTLGINAATGAATFVTGMINGTRYSTLFTAADSVVLETNAAIPLVFNTNSTERMRITSGGNVGVGTTGGINIVSGWTNFVVNGSSTGLVGIKANEVDYGAMYASSANNAFVIQAYGASNAGIMAFLTASTERMRITSGGNIGIGTTSNLDLGVAGTVAVSIGGSTAYGGIQIRNSTGNLEFFVGGATSTDALIRNNMNGNLRFGTNEVERMRITSGGAIVHEGLNVRKTKSGGTSVSFVINLAATGYWAPGYATIRVAASRGGLQEHYAAMYFLRITYYQGSTSAAVYNIGGDTGAASVSVSGDLVSSQSQITITVSDAGATTDYLIADLDASFQTGIASIT
jgi:hypothetical protein